MAFGFSHYINRMSVLWGAFAIYIIGIAIVLFLRPSLMFRQGSGTWKEFGVNTTGNYTIFPFWMFTMVWALLSYVVATIGAVFFASLTLRSRTRSPTVPTMESIAKPISLAPIPMQIPASEVMTPSVSRLPGYYILETPMNAAPKYIYFGTEPPTLNNLSAYSRQ